MSVYDAEGHCLHAGSWHAPGEDPPPVDDGFGLAPFGTGSFGGS
jgi:hypothetical protein